MTVTLEMNFNSLENVQPRFIRSDTFLQRYLFSLNGLINSIFLKPKKVGCKLVSAVLLLNLYGSVYFLSIISIDRCFAVSAPIMARSDPGI